MVYLSSIGSFGYKLPVLNETSNSYIRVTMYLCSDIMINSQKMYDVVVVPRGETGTLYLPGYCESNSTLFILTAYSSDEHGMQTEIPLKKIYLRHINFGVFRNNTFAETIPNNEKTIIKISDDDIISMNKYNE